MSEPTFDEQPTPQERTDATLDPPGSIVVIGTTPIGIEAALYGRYLGYDVTLIAGVDGWAARPTGEDKATRLGPTFRDDWFERFWLNGRSVADCYDEPMPMMPDRSLSPLALSALTAQRGDSPLVLPITIRQWVEDSLLAIVDTDLLRGRVFTDTFVESISLVPLLDDEERADETPDQDHTDEDEIDDDIPPDFLLELSGQPIDADADAGNQSLRCECVIVADVPLGDESLDFRLPVDYFFRLDSSDCADAAEGLLRQWKQIAGVFAGLAGREQLDLYRPRRV